MGKLPKTMSASVCFRLLPMAMLVAVLHTSNATIKNDDAQIYAAWLTDENSQSTAHSSIEADKNVQNANPTSANDEDAYANWLSQENLGSLTTQALIENDQISIRAYRRSGGGSGSGSGSGATLAPTKAPTKAPTMAPSEAYVETATTVDASAVTVQEVKHDVKVTIPGGVQGYTGATKQVSECAFGKSVTVMYQAANGTCYNKPGNDLTSVAKASRRSEVTITFTILVDSAVSETTLTAIVATADAITPASLTTAVHATIAANPEFASATVPTVLSIQPAQEVIIHPAEEEEDNNSGVIIAVVICCILLVIAASVGGYCYYKKTQESDSEKSDHVQMEMGAEEVSEEHNTETILIQQPGVVPGVLYSVEFDDKNKGQP